MTFEEHVAGALTRTFLSLSAVRMTAAIDELRMIVFSDQHRGRGDGADDFDISRNGRSCKRAYNAALASYHARGFTLVALGDVEELWECWPGQPTRHHRDTLELEGAFHRDGRYLRVVGNHDDAWRWPENVARHLQPVLGAPLEVVEAVHVRLTEGGEPRGALFLTHGHQGTLLSDRLRGLGKALVRYLHRPLQRLLRYPTDTAATDFALRGRHELAMFEWAARRNASAEDGALRTVLIAGHTHHPVFSSLDLVAQLDRRIADDEVHLRALSGADREAAEERLVALRARREWAAAETHGHPSPLTGERPPCYFNSGCCCFPDGDITGLELADGQVRLVRWPDDAGRPAAKVLAAASLRDVLSRL